MSETVTQNQATEEKGAYTINVDVPERFAAIASSMYIDSNEFCLKAHELFKAAFADSYGFTFDLIQGSNVPMMSAYFDHFDHAEGIPTAVTKDISESGTKNTTLRSTRQYSRRLSEGDRYHITDEGKEAIAPFMMDYTAARKIYQTNDIKWDSVLAEVADTAYNGMAQNQVTKVSYLDPNKIAAKIFGEFDEEGNRLEYGVSIVRSMPTFNGIGSAANNYLLSIARVTENEVYKFCERFGIVGYQPGLNIIRSTGK